MLFQYEIGHNFAFSISVIKNVLAEKNNMYKCSEAQKRRITKLQWFHNIFIVFIFTIYWYIFAL